MNRENDRDGKNEFSIKEKRQSMLESRPFFVREAVPLRW